MAHIDFDRVTKRFGDVEAVSDLSLHVDDGDFLVLLGPSGCGKSTLLRMLAGLEEPSEGVILFAGEPVNNVAPKDRDIAMVFQCYALYPHKTVRPTSSSRCGPARCPGGAAGGRGGRRAAGPTRCSSASPASSPAASSSGWPWPGRSSGGRRCS